MMDIENVSQLSCILVIGLAYQLMYLISFLVLSNKLIFRFTLKNMFYPKKHVLPLVILEKQILDAIFVHDVYASCIPLNN